MDRKSLVKFTVFGVFVFLGVIGFRLWQKGATPSPLSKLRDYAQAPVKKEQQSRVESYVAETHSGGAEAPEASTCQEQRRRWLSTPLNELLSELENGRLVLATECEKADSELAEPQLARQLYATCQKQLLTTPDGVEACAAALFFLKSVLVSNSNRGRSMQDLEVEALVHELFARLGRGDLKTTEDIRELRQVTDELAGRLPTSAGAQKAAMIPHVIELMQNADANRQPSPEFLSQLEQARALDPHDAELENIELMILTREGKSISLEKAEAAAAANSQSVTAQIFYAKALARHNQVDGARALLVHLAQSFPGRNEIVSAQAELEKNSEQFGQFQINLGSGDL